MGGEKGNGPLRVLAALWRRWPVGVFSALVVLAIVWLTLAPHPLPENDMPRFPGADKLAHALMFGGLYFALAFDCALHRRRHGCMRLLTWPLIVALAASSALFGGVVEMLQQAMGIGRSGDSLDFLADIAGVLIALWPTSRLLPRLIFL